MLNKSQAIILKKYDFGETSFIVSFFTKDYGKIKGILKGARQDPKKFTSPVENFSFNEVIFYPTKESELHLISQCDLIEDFPNLKKDLRLIGFANYIVEFIDALMPLEDKNDKVFDLLLWSLKMINDGVDVEKIKIIFQIKLLDLSGFRPHLDFCVICQKTLDYQAYFSPHQGGIICKACFPKEKKARAIFRGTIASILHIQRNNLESLLNLGIHPKIKSELRNVLSSFIEFNLQKKLKSENFIHSVTNSARLEKKNK